MSDNDLGALIGVIAIGIIVAIFTSGITSSTTNARWINELKAKGIVVESKDVYGNKHFDYAN